MNLGVAASSVEPDGSATLEWIDTADVSAPCADRCVSKLWSYLDDLLALLSWTTYTVLIERQPSKACSLMRSVELGIRHYFLMRAHRGLERIAVKSVSPRKKLGAPVQYSAGSTKSQQYKARKSAGVAEAMAALAKVPLAAEVLASGKADDCCDALMYHIRFFNATNFVAMSEHALRNPLARAAARADAAAEKAAARDLKARLAAEAKAAAAAEKAAARAMKRQKNGAMDIERAQTCDAP